MPGVDEIDEDRVEMPTNDSDLINLDDFEGRLFTVNKVPLNDVHDYSPSTPIRNETSPSLNVSAPDPSREASPEVPRVSRPLATGNEPPVHKECGPDVSAPAVKFAGTPYPLPGSQREHTAPGLPPAVVNDEPVVSKSPPVDAATLVDNEREPAVFALSPVDTGHEAPSSLPGNNSPELPRPIGLDIEPAMSPRERAKRAKKSDSLTYNASGNQTTAVERSVSTPSSIELTTGTATVIQSKVAAKDVDASTVPACIEQHFVYLRGVLQGRQEDELLLNWLTLECQDEAKSASILYYPSR